MDKQDIAENYITLQESTQYCQYSQEYLSLRARSGKLKAVKFGRNWMTKKEWLDEYLSTVEEYKEYIDECVKRKETKNNGIESIKEFTKHIVAPENLPVGELGFFGKIKEAVFNFPSPEFFSNRLGFGFASAFASVLIIAGCVFGNSSLIKVFRQADSFAGIISSSGDVIAVGFLKNFSESALVVSDNINAIAENVGKAEIIIAKQTLNYFDGSARGVQKFVVNTNEAGGAIIKGIADIPGENIFAVAKDIQEEVENINYAGDKLLDCFVARNIRDGLDSYSAVFSVAGNIANDIGNSGDSLMAASVKDFKTAVNSVSALTYIVGGAGDEVIGGSLAGAKDLSLQASKISSFAVDNARAGKTALVLQASAFTDYSRWSFDSLRNKVFSLGDSIESFADNFKQRSGRALFSWKESAVEAFKSLTFAVSEKTRNIFAFMEEIPSLFIGAPNGQIAKTDNLSSVASQDGEGIVVIPVEGDEEKTKEKIKSFFSDEVEVAPRDKNSGIIIPVFKGKEGGEYMYMMVPINNKN